MHISALQIHGFGGLSDLLLDGLAPGLNVIYGPNGSGKSTLLQFMRGMLLGFDEARQLGLLPPKDWGPAVRRQAGGSVTLVDGERKIGLVRTIGVDQRQHFAVRVQGGDDRLGTEFRERIGRLSSQFVKLFTAVGTSESHAIEAMLQQAMRDGLPLSPTVSESATHHAQLTEIQRQRDELLGDAGSPSGILARLDQQRRQMAESLESARRTVIARFRTLIDREQELTALVSTFSSKVEQRHLDLQAAQQDLRSAEDALWRQRTQSSESANVTNAPAAADRDPTNASSDRQIERARQLLYDLANNRHQLSHQIADLASQTPTSSVEFTRDDVARRLEELTRERDQIDACEREVTTYLKGLQSRLRPTAARSAANVSCSASAHPVLRFSDEMREQRLAELEEQCDCLRDGLQSTWDAYQTAITACSHACERLRRVRSERSALSNDDGLDRLRFQLKVLEQESQRIHEDLQALNLAESALSRVRSSQRVETPSAIMQQASQILRKLTQERYREFRLIADSTDAVAVNQHGECLQLPLLSRGTLDQAALSLRLAIIQEYSTRGERWPIVLDEVLVDSDLDRLQLAAALLNEFAHESQQVIYLTCLEHLVEVLQSAGANVLVMPGQSAWLPLPDTRVAVGPHWLTAREGTSQRLTHETTTNIHRQGLTDQAEATRPLTSPSATVAIETRPAKHPGDGFWLQLDSPISLIPSLSSQLSGRLGSIGIRRVSDLIGAQSKAGDQTWEELRITPQQLAIWQAEAVMLYCIPRLNGRDAQLLVAAGIMNPGQLARESATTLMRRLDRLRGTSLERGVESVWPRHADLASWITAAGQARALPAGLQENPAEAATEPANESSPSAASTTNEWRFFLDLMSPVVDAPSIGPTTARKLARIGVNTVSELLNRDAEVIANRLDDRRVTAESVLTWQRQANLMLRVPELRGHDAQVLVACGIIDPETLAGSHPSALFATVAPFVATKEGQRLLRSAKTPDLTEVSDWIEWARHARALRAA